MKLLLLRHGATPGNLKKQYIGSTDQPLASLGIRQAKERSRDLPPVEKVWGSSMIRARQTADIFFPDQSKIYLDALREMDFGDCEEKTWEEINDPTIYDGWLNKQLHASFPGGETLEDLLTRTTEALREIAQTAEQEQLSSGAVVAHGGVLMAILSQYGIPKRDFFEWDCPNCGGFEVEFDIETLRMDVTARIGEEHKW